MSIIELLVGNAIGLGVLALLSSGTVAAGHLLTHVTGRGELHDIADLAAEAFRFDLRRAGFAPGTPLADPLRVARTDRLTVVADLDGNGSVDPSSEETVAIACLSSPGRVSRIVGAQSLPLANDVVTCRLRYFDDQGVELVPPAAGLDVTTRRRIATVELAFTLSSSWMRTTVTRRIVVARRGTT